MTTHETVRKVPVDGEWFDLEVDDDVDPMSIVTTAGYNPTGWKYLGPRLRGRRRYQVTLKILGFALTIQEARAEVDRLGCRLLEGQARDVFKGKFPQPDNGGFIVFGGSTWELQRFPNKPVAALLRPQGKAWKADVDLPSAYFHNNIRWAIVLKGSS